MAQRIIALVVILSGFLFSSLSQASLFAQKTAQFVPASQAFIFDFRQQGNQVTLQWQVKPGYYLYQHQISIQPHNAVISPIKLPDGIPHKDEFYGNTITYPQNLTLPVTLLSASTDASLSLSWQGCAAAGFCYPPETHQIPLTAVEATSTALPVTPANTDPGQQRQPFSPLWALLIGIGIAFTPCVLPMYPLIAGIILGGDRRQSPLALFTLAMSYVQGMALTYTLAGILVAAVGLPLQALLQHPSVLIGLSVIFTLLALSMFGVFNLQLPSSLQTRLALWSNKQHRSLAGIFLMGALAGLICTPCTTAPLSAILLYIAQSGSLWAGGITLWLYALGMGLPLILVTMTGNKLLPKSGPWMQTVKEGFGFIILALPVFLLERLVSETTRLQLWSMLGVAFFSWGFITSLRTDRRWAKFIAILLLAGAVIVVRPLQDAIFSPVQPQATPAKLGFTTISNTDQLTAALQNNRVTMLDLYADWCVACKEFERETFRDPRIQQQLAPVQRLQVNMTSSTPQKQQLLQQLQVMGLPTMLFFDNKGNELPALRVTGFMDATTFHKHLQQLPQ